MISAPKTDINIRDCRWTDTKPGKVMGKAIFHGTFGGQGRLGTGKLIIN